MRIFLSIICLISWAGFSVAQDADAIEDVIGRQLEAFNDRDVESAWQFASPTIKNMFGDAQVFGMMVQRGYPMVWSNRNTQFLELQDMGTIKIQRIIIEDTSGISHLLEYRMIETIGGWRIAGVSILPPPDVGA